MKSIKQVAAVLALLSFGVLVVSCNRANLQEVLEEQHRADEPTHTLVEIEVKASPEPEVMSTTEVPLFTTKSLDEETTNQQAQAADKQNQETPKSKRVKVITIAAPDYSIRIETKPDTPLAIGSEEDMKYEPDPPIQEEEEKKKEEDDHIIEDNEPVVAEESKPLDGDSPKVASVQKQKMAKESATSSEVKVSERKDKEKSMKTDGSKAAEQALDEEKEVKLEVSRSQVNKNKGRKGARTEERTKRQVKQSQTGGKGPNQKRDKRETKKSGTSKNSKAKRSAEKSRKYNKNKGPKGKSSKK